MGQAPTELNILETSRRESPYPSLRQILGDVVEYGRSISQANKESISQCQKTSTYLADGSWNSEWTTAYLEAQKRNLRAEEEALSLVEGISPQDLVALKRFGDRVKGGESIEQALLEYYSATRHRCYNCGSEVPYPTEEELSNGKAVVRACSCNKYVVG